MRGRAAAGRALGRVLRGGAYTNIVVRTETTDLPLDEQRTARRLLYGPLRHLGVIDTALEEAVDRPLRSLDAMTLDLLRIGAYELLMGDTPAHAAVDSAVEASRLVGQGRAAPLINAVLRRISRNSKPIAPAVGQAMALGQPNWILETVARQWGEDEAVRFLEESQTDAPPSFWLEPGAELPPGAEPVVGIENAYTSRFRPPDEAPGLVRVDPSSVAVAQALEATTGQSVLDLAAAPGGKTLIIESLSPGLTVAGDVHSGRVVRARRRAARVGSSALWVLSDGTEPPFRRRSFDRVLVDAPCTGLGTLRRRPEIRHRIKRGDPARLGRLQRALLESALELVRPGGLVVYSVCTVFAEETVGVIEGLGAGPPGGLPGRAWGDGWLLAPHLTGTDGMFVAQLSRT